VSSTAAIRGGFVSSFRLICITALTVAMAGFAAGAAAAQSAAEQSGKPYLVGLHPPREHHKPAQKTKHVSTERKPARKTVRRETRRRPAVAANSNAHRPPQRLADKINPRVAWPSAEPAAADDRPASETVLQFATEDTGPVPAAASPAPTPTATISTAKTASPGNIAAPDKREEDEPDTVDAPPPAASKLVQTERFDAPASNQMRVILPPQTEEPIIAATVKEQPARSKSTAAALLATLAGAIAAGVVGWLMISFGSVRTIKSRQT
jgi:hypothetical protein